MYGVYSETGSTGSRYFPLCLLLFCAIPALVFSWLSTYHGCKIFDVPLITEGGTYFIVVWYKVFILSCTKFNVPQFKAFFQTLNEDFKHVCTDGKRYRERFFQNQLLTWKVCIFVTIFMMGIGVVMVSFAVLTLVFYLLTRESPSDGKRPLLFPFWFRETDFNKSPTYEIAFLFSSTAVLAYCFNYVFMITTQILWVRQIGSKADLVIWGIQDLLNGIYPTTDKREADIFSSVIKYRMRTIIQQHHSMHDLLENYARVHKKLLMFEQIFCGPVVCLTAYSAAEKLDEGEVHTILILLCVAAITVAFVPSYLCSFLRVKVSSVADACCGIPFWNAGTVIRPYMVLIIQRSLRPLPLRFGGFDEVSVQTFANKMTSAYSLFNMLRQGFK